MLRTCLPEPYRTKYKQNLYAGEVAYADAIVR